LRITMQKLGSQKNQPICGKKLPEDQ